MSRSSALYDAYELKRSYQLHLGWGITIGAALQAAAILSLLYLVRPSEVQIMPTLPMEPLTDGESVLDRVRQIDWKSPGAQAATSSTEIPELYGIPIPAPDEDFTLDYTAPRDDNSVVDVNGAGMGSGSGTDMRDGMRGFGPGTAGSDSEPLSGVFVAVESSPVRIKHVSPDFPEMARLTGREGKVVVRALVDRDGTVRRAEIARSSGTNVGFEQAAEEAALRCLYKPAIQNGMPVMVWVTYVVEFKLK